MTRRTLAWWLALTDDPRRMRRFTARFCFAVALGLHVALWLIGLARGFYHLP